MKDEYYEDNKSRIDTILGDIMAVMVSKCRGEWKEQNMHAYPTDFEKYLFEEHGIQTIWNNGFIEGFRVVDEKKYFLFVLNYA